MLEPAQRCRRLCPGVGIHAAGYCLGGTLPAMGVAVLGRTTMRAFKTVSILAGQVDFVEPELGLFMDESQVAFLKDLMAESGYLDGRRMAGAFQLINSKDLVWSKLLHEYLMGAHTPMTPHARLERGRHAHAHAHAERIPAAPVPGQRAGPGHLPLRGEHVTLRAIHAPMFVVATERDHVSPWTSVYKILRLVHARARFVLVSGGHNVGIVSPPSGPSAHPVPATAGPTTTRTRRPPIRSSGRPTPLHVPGSWWKGWHSWLREHGTTGPRHAWCRTSVRGSVGAGPRHQRRFRSEGSAPARHPRSSASTSCVAQLKISAFISSAASARSCQ